LGLALGAAEESVTPAYELDAVEYAYDGRSVLSVEHLAIGAGRITALIGPNGAGKTTLLNLLAFLVRPMAGRLSFFGGDAAGEDPVALRRRVGWVAQNPYFLRGSVADNVELALKLRGFPHGARRPAVVSALDRVGLAGFADRPVAALSGGERQRVALARALAPKPEVLLFDEPFTYLDQGGVGLIEGIIAAYAREGGNTVIFSTHERLHGAALADDSVSLFAGKPVEAPLINLFRGHLGDGAFDTGKLVVRVPQTAAQGTHLALDPEGVVLSPEPLDSSLRNAFSGRIVVLAEDVGRIRVTVDVGEKLHAFITAESLHRLDLKLGKTVWVSFKATAVKVF
jgi:tungstate transport system ATP-binding protein